MPGGEQVQGLLPSPGRVQTAPSPCPLHRALCLQLPPPRCSCPLSLPLSRAPSGWHKPSRRSGFSCLCTGMIRASATQGDGRDGESSWGHGRTRLGRQAGHPRTCHACRGPATGTSPRRGSRGGNHAGAGGNRSVLLAGDGMRAMHGPGSPPSPRCIPLSPLALQEGLLVNSSPWVTLLIPRLLAIIHPRLTLKPPPFSLRGTPRAEEIPQP